MQSVFRALAIDKGHTVLLTGSSAGGMGVINNADYVGQYLNETFGAGSVSFSALADSGFFLPNQPYKPGTRLGGGGCN